jgi:hypothetical protein
MAIFEVRSLTPDKDHIRIEVSSYLIAIETINMTSLIIERFNPEEKKYPIEKLLNRMPVTI